MRDPYHRFLRRVRRRMRLSWLAATIQHSAPVLLGVAAVVLVVHRFVPISGVWTALAVGFGAAVVVVLVVAALLRISEWDAARVAERGLHARDVLTTALEFTSPDDAFHVDIQRRAEAVVNRARPSDAVPIQPDRRRLAQVGVMAAVVLVLGLLPPFGASPALSAEESLSIGAEADEIERIAEAVEHAAVEGADELAEELRRLAEELRSTTSSEEALRLLDEADDRLRAGLDPDFLSEKAAVQGLSRDLTLRPLVPDGPADAAGQFEALADALDELSPQEREALEDRLRDLAASQTAGNPAVAGKLAAAASALSAGELEAARQALMGAAAEQRAAIGSARGQQALTETLRALDGAVTRLSSGGSGDGSGEGNGSGEGSGEGGGSGAGQGGGQGSGQGSGGGTGGGAGSGTISGVQPGDGGAAGQGGVGTPGAGTAQDGSSEVKTSTVFDPADSVSVSDQLQVGIGGGFGDGAILGRGDAPTTRGEAVVPYTQVLPEYLAEAADALDALSLPPSMRTIVQTYFERLAAEAS